ncbi:hypothetical protein HDV00_000269 [Rhizophlyctis rosea]|nr:hypothetical protein HDV00_000269 [Rhizophlyctis rosea]
MVEWGYCLLNGWGIGKDKREAGKWFRRACLEGGAEIIGESWIWKEKWGWKGEVVHGDGVSQVVEAGPVGEVVGVGSTLEAA